MTHRLLSPRNSLGKNTGVGCHSLLQGIFLNQGSNPGLPPCRQIPYHVSHQGSPIPPLDLETGHRFSWGTASHCGCVVTTLKQRVPPHRRVCLTALTEFPWKSLHKAGIFLWDLWNLPHSRKEPPNSKVSLAHRCLRGTVAAVVEPASRQPPPARGSLIDNELLGATGFQSVS